MAVKIWDWKEVMGVCKEEEVKERKRRRMTKWRRKSRSRRKRVRWRR